jgi:molybdopterin-synthase adenylyltransferase
MERDGYLDNPTYIAGLPATHALRRNENIFGFSMSVASLEVLQFLSMVVAPSGISNPGSQMYHFVTGTLDTTICGCDDGCPYPSFTARGDTSGVSVTGRHALATAAREHRRQLRQSWEYRLLEVRTLGYSILDLLKR